jgi:hypothetical protein
MSNVHMFLTLYGFDDKAGGIPYLSPDSETKYFTPVTRAIFGGYVLYAGSIWTVDDFEDPNIFASKLAN